MQDLDKYKIIFYLASSALPINGHFTDFHRVHLCLQYRFVHRNHPLSDLRRRRCLLCSRPPVAFASVWYVGFGTIL